MDSNSFVASRDFLISNRENYEAAYAGFSWPQLENFNWALDYFDPMAKGNDALALCIASEDGSEAKLTFSQISERSNRVANFLRGLGVRRGDRLIVMLPNVVALWEITLAVIKLGAVISPATTLLTHVDLADRVARGSVRWIVTDPARVAGCDELPARCGRIVVGGTSPGWTPYADADKASAEFTADAITKASEPLFLYFTSGTTSKPKMVLHSHASYPIGHLSTMYWIGLKPGDLHWNISSPGWAKHAWSCFFAPWNAGAGIFLFEQSRFNPKRALDTLVRCAVTSLCAPPTVWRTLALEDLKAYPVTLRELLSAGEPLNPEIIDKIRAAWGVTIRDGYGQTETTCMIGNSPGQPVQPGSMGRPMPGYRIALLDVDGNVADEGEVSLALDPPPLALMSGYVDAEHGRTGLADGYYRTSDIASRGADGYFIFVGRTDDVFKSSDYRVSPFELESVLIEHAAVAEAAVVPSPDPQRLSVPKGFIVLKPGVAPDAATALSIFMFLKERVAPYKRIRLIQFSDLPKTISGKIRRVELRRDEVARREGNVVTEHEFNEVDFPELKA